MTILEEWFLLIIQLVTIFLAASLLNENYLSNKRPRDLWMVISFWIITLKQTVLLFIISGRIFFYLKGRDPMFLALNNILETLFYLFMACAVLLGYDKIKLGIKRLISIFGAFLAVSAVLAWYYWALSGHERFTSPVFFEIIHLGLIGVIIAYLYLQNKGLFKTWMQAAFYLILSAHIINLNNLIAPLDKGDFFQIEEAVLFAGYLLLALSQIKFRIQPKFIMVIISVVLFSTLLTVLMVSNEVKNRLTIFTYEKVSREGILDTVYELKKVLYLIAGLGVVLASFIGYIFSSKIIKPLNRLVKGARRVGEGDLNGKIDIQTDDELRELADEFNEMTAKLKLNTSKLEKTNEALNKVNQELIKKGQELIHAAKLASIGQLAGGVAHEINNPLTAILGWSQLGQEMIENKGTKIIAQEKEYLETLKKYLNIIEKGGRRCQLVTESLLKISRQMELTESKMVDINQLLDDVFAMMKYQSSLKKIRIKKDLAPNLPSVNVNPGQIQQVFFDIISNATLAMPEEGELFLATSTKGHDFIEIKVTDTGCGISRENIDKLFSPFFTTREANKGMGLGLSVAYGIIKQHNGDIEVKSAEGIGTTFTIRLPIAGR
ncbi:MAG: ATP-binding protein [Candidatus Omnitrophica bacterium]|nr:ATP-binding protein [Candidatus Omnitrophota bacterium]